ncbi:DUF3558 domain-containing protein [Rhodococcus sp. TAF43]|uniref:DUF3558 domain-containing protein n=1 Tax=unclassified Rhodococcus (in: high G+C Gram-positive bacteria) TaxID=192944 RepID=UPI000E0C2A76|nr:MULTISPECIES: DUF3558 domain-containing protein [unclassified Rhodococcus (in: high G+C Gram-positive bacteria)]QKT12847.1 DUF3558 domain-containing protein [Rhodococcus sp. W8901]RDI33892.1 uncharacterized protein DUF3558 [Rhodococcus sp. AG1013]
MSNKLVGVLAGVAVLVTGCGAAAGGSDESSGSSASTARTSGPFFGECGSVTDEEVAAAFGVPSFGSVVRNSVGCEWQVSPAAGQPGPHVSFSWYRGSPIGRERAGSELIGRPATDIEIEGRPGFEASVSSRLCELGVEFDDDFVHWSVAYVDSVPSADPCTAARHLAELTASRGK